MPTIALEVLERLDRDAALSHAERQALLEQVPASQWSVQGGHWSDLARYCGNRAEVREEPRFMNRLSINRMTPLPRCLFRSPDGRGLLWLRSGGEVEAYGRCEQQHCEKTKQKESA